MKILKRNMNLLIEEEIETNLNELVALDKCEELNEANKEDGVYYIVITDDYILFSRK
jgi:hypothetical protein